MNQSLPISSTEHKKKIIFGVVVISLEMVTLLPFFVGASLRSPLIYAPLVVFALLIVSLTLHNIHLGVCIFILLIPFLNMGVRRFAVSVGSIAFNPTSFILWTLFVIYFLGSLIKRKDAPHSYLPLDIAIISLAILGFFSILSSYYIGTPVSRSFIVYLTGIIEPVFLYFILKGVLNTENKIKNLLFVIVLAMGIGCLMGFYLMKQNMGNMLTFLSTRGGSMGFGFRGTNLYGVATALTFPLTVLFVVTGRTKTQKIISAGIMSLMFISVLTTFTRGIQITLAVEILILTIFYKHSRKFLLPLVGLLILASVFYLNQIVFLFHRFTETSVSVLVTSTGARLEAWRVSIRTLGIFPFGLGGGNFDYIWEKLKPLHIIPMGASHHIFLSVGTEYGLPTMITFIILFLMQFKMCWWILKRSKDEMTRNVTFMITVSLIGYCVYGVTTGGELSHLIECFPAITINSFTLILFTLFSIVTVLFIKEKRKLQWWEQNKNSHTMSV